MALDTPAAAFPPPGVSFLTGSDSFVEGSVSLLFGEVSADSLGGVGFDRAGVRRLELRGVDLAVVLAVVDFGTLAFLAPSVAVLDFTVSGPVATARGSETGAG